MSSSISVLKLKYISIIFHLLCSIFGILWIVDGFFLLSNIPNIDDSSRVLRTHQIPIAMIVLGSVLLLISCFGCCGALSESYYMSLTYSILIFLLMIGQLAIVACFWLKKEEYVLIMDDVIDRAWQQQEAGKADYMAAIQIGLECCGYNSFQDYVSQGQAPTCRVNIFTYQRGCKEAFGEFWDRNIDIIKYSGLAIAALEFLDCVFACLLVNSFRKRPDATMGQLGCPSESI